MVKTMTVAQLIERTEPDALFYSLRERAAFTAAQIVNEARNLSGAWPLRSRVQVCGKLVRTADTGKFVFRII